MNEATIGRLARWLREFDPVHDRSTPLDLEWLNACADALDTTLELRAQLHELRKRVLAPCAECGHVDWRETTSDGESVAPPVKR